VGYALELLNEAHTALQAERSRVQLLMSLPGFFTDLWLHHGPGVDSASNRNEYLLGNKGGRCVGLTTLQSSYLEILAAQSPEALRACPRHVIGFFIGGGKFLIFDCCNCCQLTQMQYTNQ